MIGSSLAKLGVESGCEAQAALKYRWRRVMSMADCRTGNVQDTPCDVIIMGPCRVPLHVFSVLGTRCAPQAFECEMLEISIRIRLLFYSVRKGFARSPKVMRLQAPH